MAVKFFNMTRAEFLSKKLLYKYMPLEHALDLLINKRLWFANPTIWKDPFEKRFIVNKYDIGGVQRDFPWMNRVYAMCMTQTSTSEAYWNTYANNDIGISFKFNRQNLLAELERISNTNGVRIFIGRVEYQKTSDIKRNLSKNPFLNVGGVPISNIGKEETKVRLLLLKRIAYRYEDEIRFFVVRDKTANIKGTFVPFGIPNTSMIEAITIDPNIGVNTVKMLKKIFENDYGFLPRAHNQKRVQRSLLYSANVNDLLKI